MLLRIKMKKDREKEEPDSPMMKEALILSSPRSPSRRDISSIIPSQSSIRSSEVVVRDRVDL